MCWDMTTIFIPCISLISLSLVFTCLYGKSSIHTNVFILVPDFFTWSFTTCHVTVPESNYTPFTFYLTTGNW